MSLEIIKKTILISFFTAIFVSCQKSSTNNSLAHSPSCSGTTPSFSAKVNSLIMSNCAISGYHSTERTSGPDALNNSTEISNTSAFIRNSVVIGRMPKGFTLTEEQKNNPVCWIDGGSKNN